MITHSVDAVDEDDRTVGNASRLDFPQRLLMPLLVAAAAYGLYRMVQTVLLAPPAGEPNLSAASRVIVSAADGCLMALAAPIAWMTSRRCPISAPHLARCLAVHTVVAFTFAGIWILTMMGVYATATGTPIVSPFQSTYLGWLTTNVFAYCLLVAVLHSLSFQHRLRRREVQAARLQTQLTTARLDNLKSQLNPHFLFNTLNTISELTHVDPAGADRMVTSLGRLLRLSLDSSSQSEVRLSREIELVGAYLELQQMRYGDRLVFDIQMPSELSGVLVPPMLLQPLVENSVRHGITPRSTQGHLWIRAVTRGSLLRLTVEDDGVGLPATIDEGVGLGNTRARLAELFGSHHSFAIERRSEGGVRIAIEFPAPMG